MATDAAPMRLFTFLWAKVGARPAPFFVEEPIVGGEIAGSTITLLWHDLHSVLSERGTGNRGRYNRTIYPLSPAVR